MSEPKTWHKLASFPNNESSSESISEPVFINKHEFVVCSSKESGTRDRIGIDKYNTKQNRWERIMNYPQHFHCYADTAAYDSQNHSLYVSRAFGSFRLFKIDMNTLELQELTNIVSTDHAKLIRVNNELHTMGGLGMHKTWKIEENSLRRGEIYKIDEKHFGNLNLSNPGVIYLKSRKCILLFHEKSIFKFSITNKKWEKLQTQIPKTMTQSAIVKTRDERFVIIAGSRSQYKDIFVYDVKNGKFANSNIKTPTQSIFHAVMLNDSERDNKLCFGFIRDCYKNNAGFLHLQELPFYLMQFVSKWYQNQEIYLLDRDRSNDENHWKINVDYILQNVI